MGCAVLVVVECGVAISGLVLVKSVAVVVQEVEVQDVAGIVGHA